MNFQFPAPIEQPRASRRFKSLLLLAGALLFAFYMAISVSQYRAGLILGDPVTTFDHILSNNVAGNWFEHPRRAGNHYFTNHVMLWMIPATLLYYVHDGLFTYISLINLGLAFAVVPLGLLARRLTASEPIAWAVVLLWGLNTLTVSMLFSLHCENLCFPVWFLLFWALEGNRTRVVWLAAVGLLLIKQDYAVWLTIFGVWMVVFRRKDWRLGVSLAVFGVVSFLVFKGIMRALPSTGDAEVGYYWVVERYGGVASTPAELVLYFFSHPVALVKSLARPVWVVLILAGGGICLLGWRAMLLTIPPAFLFFTAEFDVFNSLFYYYCYPFLPFIFLAVCEGSRLALDFAQERRTLASRVVAGMLATSTFAQLFLPSRADGHMLRLFEVTDRDRATRAFVELNVPREDRSARVMAQWGLVAFVPRGSQRVAMSPEKLADSDRVVLDTQGPAWDVSREQREALNAALVDPEGDWVLSEEIDGFLLFVRKGSASR